MDITTSVLTITIRHKSGMTARQVKENIDDAILPKNDSLRSVDVYKTNFESMEYVYPVYHLSFYYTDIELDQRMLRSKYDERTVTKKKIESWLEGVGYEIYKYLE